MSNDALAKLLEELIEGTLPRSGEELERYFKEHAADFLGWRLLDDGRYLAVDRLLWGYARLGIGVGTGVYEDEWHYETAQLALAAMAAFNPDKEPHGWHRHPSSGRRRPNGDASKEFVRP